MNEMPELLEIMGKIDSGIVEAVEQALPLEAFLLAMDGNKESCMRTIQDLAAQHPNRPPCLLPLNNVIMHQAADMLAKWAANRKSPPDSVWLVFPCLHPDHISIMVHGRHANGQEAVRFYRLQQQSIHWSPPHNPPPHGNPLDTFWHHFLTYRARWN